jgi:serine/threonine protein kinase
MTPREERPPEGPSAPRIPDHEILKRIGSGSYGDVWLAQSAAGKLRAVKVVWRSRFTSQRPYEREFKGICQFEPISRAHAGVIDILHIGQDEEAGCFFYVMELADAVESAATSTPAQFEPRTLASELRARGRMSLTEVLTLGVQLADALGHLHRHRLVHRDVKPSNVIFVGGLPKLADIGLVTGADQAKSFVGTEGFIPPEGPGSVQADLFGLGRLLYEAATGKDRCEFPDLPEDLDAWDAAERNGLLELNEILARACAPRPSDRHANAAELAGDLNHLLAGQSIRRFYGAERRLRHAMRILGVAVITALLALGTSWFQKAQRRRAEERAQQQSVLRERAEQAEGRATELLRESLLNQAIALTSSSEPDRRTRALAALKQAAVVRPGLDLVNAAIAALSTPELRVVRRWNPRGGAALESVPDSLLRRYMRRQPDGSVTVHSLTDDAEVLRLPATGAVADHGLFSPDGAWLAVVYHDRTARLWNLSTRAPRLVLNDIQVFAFAPDSRCVVATHARGLVQLFDLPSGRETGRQHVEASTNPVLAFHPSEPLFLLSGFHRGRIEIRRVEDGSLDRSIEVPEMGLVARFSADGKSLVTAHRDFAVRVWDWPAMGAPRLVLPFHRAEPTYFATDPSGRWLMTAGWDTQVSLFDLRDGRLVMSQTAQAVHAAKDRPAFVVVNEADWRLVELEAAFAFEAIPMHERDKTPRDVAFGSTGRWLATAGPDGVRVLDLVSRDVHVLSREVSLRVAVDPDSTRIVAVTPDRLAAWRIETDPETGRLRPEPAALPDGGERGFRHSPTAGIHDGATLWLAVSEAPTRSWLLGRFDTRGTETRVDFPTGGNGPELSPDGTWLAWGNWQQENAAVKRLGAEDPPVELQVAGSATVSFSPDGRLLVVGGPEEIAFHEVGTWRVLHRIPRLPVGTLPPQFAFTHDSKLCAAALPPDRVLLLDAVAGVELATLPATPHILSRMAFSPDDRFLAAASTDHHLLLWDLEELRHKLRDLGLDWQIP